MAESGFSLSTTRTWLVGAIVAGLSALLVAGAVTFVQGTTRTILVNVGSTTLSIGLITVVYDVFIRKSFAKELLQLVRLEQNLANAGIQEIVEESQIEWRKLLTQGTDFCLVLIDASAWVERDWQHVLAASRKHPTRVEVYLPDTEAEGFSALAAHLGLDSTLFGEIVSRAARQFEDSWVTARQTSPSLNKQATLNIHGYKGICSYSLFIVDEEAVIVLSPSVGRAPGSTGAAFRFRLNEREMPSRWILQQRDQIQSRDNSIIYANE